MASIAARVHVIAQQQLRDLLSQAVEEVWFTLPGYDRENVDEWLSRVLPLVDAAQRRSVALTDAYLARERGRDVLGVPVDETTGAPVRNGTPPEVVYQRPLITLWSALADGASFAQAFARGLDRATSAAETDALLSMRAAASWVGEIDDGIYGYERVTDGSACDLCQIASTQRYHTSQLMPIHSHCGCSVAPLTEPAEGGIVNRDLYRQLKADRAMDRITAARRERGFRQRADANEQRARRWRREAASEQDPERRERLIERADRYEQRAAEQRRTAEQLAAGDRRVPEAVAVREHGELGPVLTDASHRFTSQDDLPLAA